MVEIGKLKRWSTEEENLLRDNFNMSYGELMNIIPKRSKRAIEAKIRALKLPREIKTRVIDINEIYSTYSEEELVVYYPPSSNQREIICLKRENDYLNSECHIVISHHKDKDGYAEMRFNNKRGKIGIHRYIFELYNDLIHKGNVVRHMCHNPSCCNPNHLKQGTNKENSNDMVLAGRSLEQHGSKNNCAILSEDEVYEIKKLYKEGIRPVDLVNIFGRNRSTINNIIYEYQWTHVKVV